MIPVRGHCSTETNLQFCSYHPLSTVAGIPLEASETRRGHRLRAPAQQDLDCVRTCFAFCGHKLTRGNARLSDGNTPACWPTDTGAALQSTEPLARILHLVSTAVAKR